MVKGPAEPFRPEILEEESVLELFGPGNGPYEEEFVALGFGFLEGG